MPVIVFITATTSTISLALKSQYIGTEDGLGFEVEVSYPNNSVLYNRTFLLPDYVPSTTYEALFYNLFPGEFYVLKTSATNKYGSSNQVTVIVQLPHETTLDSIITPESSSHLTFITSNMEPVLIAATSSIALLSSSTAVSQRGNNQSISHK